jgi:hypothetical protein
MGDITFTALLARITRVGHVGRPAIRRTRLAPVSREVSTPSVSVLT